MITDEAAVALQLGRPPRGLRAVAHRCRCGLPDVVETAPRLPDGTPFPTLYYLTCPRATVAISRLEASGLMKRMQDRLAADGPLRAAYQAAHSDYLARREQAATAAGVAPLPAGTQSAGGMPARVKCLHALAAHELAAPGTNPLGAQALAEAGPWWEAGPCVPVEPAPGPHPGPAPHPGPCPGPHAGPGLHPGLGPHTDPGGPGPHPGRGPGPRRKARR